MHTFATMQTVWGIICFVFVSSVNYEECKSSSVSNHQSTNFLDWARAGSVRIILYGIIVFKLCH